MSPPYLPLIAFRPTRSIRTCVRMIVACALIPRFALLATLGDRKALLSRPIALAPEPGGPQVIGETSGPAEAFGVRAGVRLGAGSTRLCAYAAALRARPRRAPVIVPTAMTRAFLATLPVDLLRDLLSTNRAAPGGGAEEAARFISVDLPEKLERLGITKLGQLAALPSAAVADRFGEPGLRALRLARGADEPLRPRAPHEDLFERLELPAAVSGPQLERALALLVDRLLASPARRGRSLRRLRLAARLAGGGSWRTAAALRQASADPQRLRLALEPKLSELPGPTFELSLAALETGPAAGDQASLAELAESERRKRLAEAVRQARAVAGKDAVMRVLDVDVDSRVPERRSLLTPYQEAE